MRNSLGWRDLRFDQEYAGKGGFECQNSGKERTHMYIDILRSRRVKCDGSI